MFQSRIDNEKRQSNVSHQGKIIFHQSVKLLLKIRKNPVNTRFLSKLPGGLEPPTHALRIKKMGFCAVWYFGVMSIFPWFYKGFRWVSFVNQKCSFATLLVKRQSNVSQKSFDFPDRIEQGSLHNIGSFSVLAPEEIRINIKGSSRIFMTKNTCHRLRIKII